MIKKYLVLILSLLICLNFSLNSGIRNKIKTSAHFEMTCSNYRLSGSVLSADCKRSDGSINHTSVDLNTCVTNEDGSLRNYSDRFYNSCENCTLSGTSLSCSCRRSDSSLTYTSLDLSQFVDNDNGNLKC